MEPAGALMIYVLRCTYGHCWHEQGETTDASARSKCVKCGWPVEAVWKYGDWKDWVIEIDERFGFASPLDVRAMNVLSANYDSWLDVAMPAMLNCCAARIWDARRWASSVRRFPTILMPVMTVSTITGDHATAVPALHPKQRPSAVLHHNERT